jgi:CHAD domain-containing protein
MTTLNLLHQHFLEKYFKAGDHYSFEDHPVAYLRNGENVSSDDLDSALRHRSTTVRVIAADHKNATKAHFDKALNDDEPDVVINAASNINATKDHIDKAINHPHWYVRARIARSPNLDKEQLDRLRNDPDSVVSEAANHNKKFD